MKNYSLPWLPKELFKALGFFCLFCLFFFVFFFPTEHLFIEYLLCTPDIDPGAGATDTAEDKTDKNPSPYRAPGAYIPVKSRQEN